jgi:hypothetical protein
MLLFQSETQIRRPSICERGRFLGVHSHCWQSREYQENGRYHEIANFDSVIVEDRNSFTSSK